MENNSEKEGFERLHEINEKLGSNKEKEFELTEKLLEYQKEDIILEKDAEIIEEELEHGHHGEHHHHHPEHKELQLKFIVNTTATEFKVKENELLAKAVEEALKKTGNEGRPIGDWTVKYEGKDLDVDKTICELGLPDCAEIFVSLKAGGGGEF